MSREGEYEEITKTTRNVESYRSVTLEEVCGCLKHEDSIQIILKTLGNRKDADKIFISALLTSPRFWMCALAAMITISFAISYGFHLRPKQMSHIVEKTINSQVPDLLSQSVYPEGFKNWEMPRLRTLQKCPVNIFEGKQVSKANQPGGRPEFESGEADAEADKLKKFIDAGGS